MLAPDSEPGPLLTERQRDLLADRGDFSDSNQRATRSRLRGRLNRGITDFRFLADHLTAADRDKIAEGGPHEKWQFHDGMVAAIGLFYEICQSEGWEFEDLLQRAMEDVYSVNDVRRPPEPMEVGDVEFQVPLTERLPENRVFQQAKAKLWRILEEDADAALTDREFRVLWERGGVEVDNWLEVYRDRRRERNQREYREEIFEEINKNVEMFGEGYSKPNGSDEK